MKTLHLLILCTLSMCTLSCERSMELVTPGNADDSTPIRSQEPNDPALFESPDLTINPGTWIMTSPLLIARSRHTATLLTDGGILVAGGYTGQLNNPISTDKAELFDPVTNAWCMTGSMTYPRANHTATRLTSGKILVTGGRYNGMATATAELYDPNTGTWVSTGQMHHSRFFHTATLLENGFVLVTGGLSSDGPQAGKSAEIYNPGLGTWSMIDHMANGRWGHSATLLENGTVLVAGGAGPAGDGIYTPRSEIYDPILDVWNNAGNLNIARGFHAAIRLENGNVLVAGGLILPIQLQHVTATAELFDPETGKWVPTGTMAFARIPAAHGAVQLPGGHVLITGGRTSTSENYVAESGIWTDIANMHIPRGFHTVTRLSDGTVLAVGGENSDGFTASVERYIPAGTEPE